ncbi:sulfite exporter TauE/SafE family protein [Undibacterium sp. CY7W]|uniref:Sulfite exporter TauE/SafE family protein n=1 Tax=Undibacterium rugosum TaxID=2762291 RepID=A0A923IBM9_9BURK|nr:sulfite exporter TauE/SafE family protein [Undibacterium rugosum]MBC3936315.1 sulfite exporter TauE/SafE family protein [Undibacterium rugosum]
MLTLPLFLAALTAGLAGGVHCIGMCGGITVMLNQPATNDARLIPIHPAVATAAPAAASHKNPSRMRRAWLHAGRISVYMLVGAVFGGMGAAGMMVRPSALQHQILFMIGNAALILLGLKLLGFALPGRNLTAWIAVWQQKFFSLIPLLSTPRAHPYVKGLMWGCLPCGLLYSVAPFALFSGSAWSGAVLMLVFGVAALPHLLVAEGLARFARRADLGAWLRYSGAAVLILTGLLGIWFADMKSMPDFLCVLPA